MAYSADSFVADEVPTTAKWNKLWNNDASFNDGTGIADNAIINRHVTEGTIELKKLKVDYAFYGYKTGTQATTNGSAKVTLNNDLYDVGSNFDAVTNSRFTAPKNGYYMIAGGIRIANAAAARCVAMIYKNGAMYSAGVCTAADTFAGGGVAALVQMAANDYVELYHTSSTAANNFDVTSPAQALNFLCGYLVAEY